MQDWHVGPILIHTCTVHLKQPQQYSELFPIKAAQNEQLPICPVTLDVTVSSRGAESCQRSTEFSSLAVLGLANPPAMHPAGQQAQLLEEDLVEHKQHWLFAPGPLLWWALRWVVPLVRSCLSWLSGEAAALAWLQTPSWYPCSAHTQLVAPCHPLEQLLGWLCSGPAVNRG